MSIVTSTQSGLLRLLEDSSIKTVRLKVLSVKFQKF